MQTTSYIRRGVDSRSDNPCQDQAAVVGGEDLGFKLVGVALGFILILY
jgi:hypothetical protein